MQFYNKYNTILIISKFNMENKPGNKIMFYTGVIFAVMSAVLLLGNFTGESTFPTVLGIMGVVFIAASNFRLLK